MTSRAFRPLAGLLSIMLLAGTPVHAAPVAFREVIQVVGSFHNPAEIRLRSVSQTVNAPISGLSGSTRADSRVNNVVGESAIADLSADSLLSGVTLGSDDPPGVQIIDQGTIEGTICDCGELTVPGGFPKWPLLFLAGIPFIFINDGDERNPDNTPTPTPTPTPISTPTPPAPQVPEPASLILFGSGLAAFVAGLRRRRFSGAKASERRDS